MFDLRIKTVVSPLLAVTIAGLVSACAGRDSVTVGAVPDDYRTRHPIVLAEQNETLDLPVGVSSYRMTWQQRAAIEGFLARYEDSGGAVVTILVPAGAANSPAAASVAGDFASLLNRQGVPEGHVQVLSYQAGPQDAAPVRLSYPLVQATVAQCGRWPEDVLDTQENRNYFNFGCAYQNNLAAQVANPADFLGPRKMTPVDVENRMGVIDRYKGINQDDSKYNPGQVSDRFRNHSEVFYDAN